MVIDQNTELRKLRPAEVYKLALILDISDDWKKLMGSITTEEDVPRFTGESISIIEQASRQDRKPPAAIFIEEWATMGRKRPTVGFLLNLLTKMELFRAADYLAVDILKVTAPQRPTSGPAVPIDAEEALAEMLKRQHLESQQISKDSNFGRRTTSEIRLSQINYPILDTESSIIDNFAVDDNDVGIIEMRYNEPRSNQVLDHGVLENQNNPRAQNHKYSNNSETSDSFEKLKNNQVLKNNNPPGSNDSQISDLIKFSASRKTGDIDHSENLEGYSQSDLMKFNSGKINFDKSNEHDNIEISEAYLPDFNILSPNSSVKALQSSEINEGEIKLMRFHENQNSDKNYEIEPIQEMSSTELPASLDKFGTSKYFYRELVSAELPLCINDRTGFHSSEINSSRENSSATSLQSFSRSLTEPTDGVSNKETMEIIIPEREFSSVILQDGIAKRIDGANESVAEYEKVNNTLNSEELPVTVLEFYNR